MSLALEIEVSTEGGARLDHVLAGALMKSRPHLSRRVMKDYFARGLVMIEGKKVAPSLILAPGVYAVTITGWDETLHQEKERAQACPDGPFLPIAYEDENLLVLDKESGVPSVPHSSRETRTAVSSALAYSPALKDVGLGGLEPGLLHRLDNGTSGLLVFAKDQATFMRLRAAWREGQVKKTYRAKLSAPRVAGERPPLGEIRMLMAHSEKSARKMVAFPGGIRASSRYRGTPLETVTRIVKFHHPGHGNAEGELDLEIEIVTGVMHQIRCVLATLGHPLLGDVIYGGQASTRLWLHAWRLEIPQPEGSVLKLEAALPAAWKLF
jgi:23S rRNA pseudouridine1911/1915/1917 synthase